MSRHNFTLNHAVDKYLIDGCMRCKYGATPSCKVLSWVAELKLLRQIVLSTGLNEEIKWGVPVYTHNAKNIVTINALKESANIGFFKGVLLIDQHQILQQQGNIQSARIVRFKHTEDIKAIEGILISYILEAIDIEERGQKVIFQKNPEPIPDELAVMFKQEPAFKKAFHSLTAGRQRGYIIYFSQPKQQETRIRRIEKYRQQICNGIGLHDR